MPEGRKRGGGLKGKQKSTLGRAIIRQQFSAQPEETELETERGKGKLRSVTQCDDLEELMSQAVLAGTDFTSKRGEVVIVGSEASHTVIPSAAAGATGMDWGGAGQELPVPRRPSWHKGQSASELAENERAAFLAWRRGLVELEEERNQLLTPFEKNLEVWRQLWRVLERAQLIVQIVDARSPLLFRCADLERYAHEISPDKRCMLLINKADLLTESQRRTWAHHLRARGIDFLFWSAVQGQLDLDNEVRQERRDIKLAVEKEQRQAVFGEEEADGSDEVGGEDGIEGADESGSAARGDSATRVLTRAELLRLLLKRCPPPANGEARVVGLVGYPNVGKSSTVNVLVTEKKTSVSSTPGKTKHFQTLLVPDHPDLLLCDCPGLVFPSIAGSKAQMICDGVLPIDQMREYIEPVRLLCQRLGHDAFLRAYGVRLRTAAEREDDAEAPEEARELLLAHALARGFSTATKGGPDESRSARVILKDLVNGKLLYCTPPPDVKEAPTDQLACSSSKSEPQPKIAETLVQEPWQQRKGGKTRKKPSAPTAGHYLDNLRDNYNKQAGIGVQFGGRTGSTAQGSVRGAQYTAGGARPVPDRLVARGATAGSHMIESDFQY